MGSIGSFDCPETKVDIAIKSVEIFKDKLQGKASSPDALAGVWGHKSGKSGAFLQKLADLRRYGLITNRGLELTPLGEKIAKPINENELNENLKKMIFNIDLWKKIFEKLGGKMPSQDFWIMLHEVAGVDRGLAQKEAEKISKLYVDAITKIKIDTMRPSLQTTTQDIYSSDENVISGTIGDISITIPKRITSVATARKILDMLEAEIKEKKKDKK